MQNHFFAQLRPVPFFATKIPLWCSPGSAWPRLVPPGLAWPRLASKDPRQSGLGIFPKFVTIFSQGILMSFYICKIIFLLNFDPCVPLFCHHNSTLVLACVQISTLVLLASPIRARHVMGSGWVGLTRSIDTPVLPS